MCAATNKTPSDRHLGVPTPKVLSAAESNATAASFAGLTSKLDYLSATDLQSVRMAYRFSDQAHLGQLRNSCEPYITHPIAVAAQCAEWKLDAQALMAALLHDAMEDCAVTKPDLIERFGSPVAELVDGLTKLEKLQFNTREENQAEFRSRDQVTKPMQVLNVGEEEIPAAVEGQIPHQMRRQEQAEPETGNRHELLFACG